MTQPPPRFSIDEQIGEVNRELAMRRRVYPSFVERKKMTQEEADLHMALMEQVRLSLGWIKAHADELRRINTKVVKP